MKKFICNKKVISFILSAAFVLTSITAPSSVSYAAVRIKSITLNTTKLVLQEGEKAELKVTKVKPKKASKKVTYKSNKKSVASVTKKGVVTAKKEGTAKITAISKANKKIKRTVKVTVVKKTGDNTQNNPDISIQTPVPGGNPSQTPSAKPSQSPAAKPTQSPIGNQEQTDESSYPQKVLELVNKERKAQGLSEMVLDDRLCSAANIRAGETVTLFSHTRPDGTSCFTVLNELGIPYRTTGENIAYGYRTPEQVMNGWMNSEGHRANILTAGFNKLGVGYIKSGSTAYWVQLFTN